MGSFSGCFNKGFKSYVWYEVICTRTRFTCAHIAPKAIAHPVDKRADDINPQQRNLKSDEKDRNGLKMQTNCTHIFPYKQTFKTHTNSKWAKVKTEKKKKNGGKNP